MCGIAGAFSAKADNAMEQAVEAMGRAQHHRGPDNSSLWANDRVAVAHNRLSIIDLSTAGNQPFRDERYVLAYNGEIYNYQELRRELLAKGSTFSSTSDTAVLFEHLVQFGVHETLKSIRGMFAFSWYDSLEKTLYLCRDRFGIKPLAWTISGTTLYWASEVKALAAATKVKPDPVKTLFAATSAGDCSGEYTVFRDVRQVAPGSYLACKPGRAPEVVHYYSIVDDIDEGYYRELDKMRQKDIQEVFAKLLEQSVERMLMSDVPMGAFVSGGVDSSLIAAIAADRHPDINLFTANVVGVHSEFEDAKLLSRTLGKPLSDARFTADMMLQEWAKTTYHYECPIVTHTNAIPLAAVAKCAHAHGVKPVLTGEGSDELFMGYPKLLAERYRRVASAPVDALKACYGVIPPLRKYLFPKQAASNLSVLGGVVRGFEGPLIRDECHEAYSFLPAKAIAEHCRTIMMIRGGLLALLHRNDRMGMQNSVESRFPYLDEDIVRFGINLPVKWKMANTRRFYNWKHPFLIDKAVVRRDAQSRLPAALALKKKEGFPMYGHKNVRVKEGYFQDGYFAQLVGLTRKAEKHFIEKADPYHVAKMVSVDVFGRLFSFSESQTSVTERLLAYGSLVTA